MTKDNRLKNVRHERFALALFKGMSQKDAAIEAGYSPKSAIVNASRLLTKANIIKRVTELQSKAETDTIMSVTERKEKLSEIARARLSDFIEAGQDGAWINVGLDNVHSAALQEVTSRTDYDDDGSKPTVITKIKLHDPVKSISELNKMEGEYPATKLEHDIGEGTKVLFFKEVTREGSSEVKGEKDE